MHILIAPNAFKNALGATDAAQAIHDGIRQSNPSCTMTCFPTADGGDGTGELIIRHCKGSTIPATAMDPLGRNIQTSLGLIDGGKTAVIEMASASGLRLLHQRELNPLQTTSFGTGQLIRQALDHGVTTIILCIGGSATVDGATGILSALGLRFLDKNKLPLKILPRDLEHLETIDFSELDPRLHHCQLNILCDVDNLLLGPGGAAAIFGPQKGATPADVIKLDHLLARLSQVVLQQTRQDMSLIPHGGAAGGTAAGLAAMLNAQLVPGASYFLKLTGYLNELKKADVVITGEGSIDLQTLHGKGPFEIARLAKDQGKKVIGLAGKLPDPIPAALRVYFDDLICINEIPTDLATALANTRTNLVKAANKLGKSLAND